MKKEIVVLVFIFFMFSSSIPLKAGVRTLYMLAAIPNDGSFQFNFLYRDRTFRDEIFITLWRRRFK